MRFSSLLTFFLAFGQGKLFFSYLVLMNILIYIKFCDKKKEKRFKIKKRTCCNRCLFDKVLPYLSFCKEMVKPSYIKIVNRLKNKTSVHRCCTKYLLLKVLQNSQEKTCIGGFLIKLQA